jgi:Co/Zn/Cd efflux system component
VAFFSFIGFALVEIVAAIIAKSQSMLADSEAMIVDAMTYLFNLAAERLKNRPFTEQELQLPALVRDYHRKKLRLYLELIPPLISVITLLVLTFYVTRDAMDTLMAPETEDSISNEEEPSVKLMLVFSALNLALDIVNVTFFSKLKGGLGFSSLKSGGNKGSKEQIIDTAEKSSGEKSRLLLNESGEFRAYSSVSRKSQTQTFKDDTGGNLLPLSVGMESGSDVDWDIEKSGTGDEEEEESTKGNLNMCSAFTVS